MTRLDVDVLLVEDNEHDAEMTLRALKRCSFANTVVWAKDGVEALDFIFCRAEFADRDPAQQVRLILLDLKMPRLDGHDVLRALKSNERTKSIPVVVMTSSNEERDIAESYLLGVNAYVTKPVQVAAFTETVEQIGAFWLKANQATRRLLP
jgi:CheY-like chemotaxis protein